MATEAVTGQMNDDPRKLRALLTRVETLARDHAMSSVVVGLAAEEGDRSFPEFVDYLRSTLRVEDGIFRMTRERVVLHLADLDRERATEVLERLMESFQSEFSSVSEPSLVLRFLEVKPGQESPNVKDVLTAIFSSHTLH